MKIGIVKEVFIPNDIIDEMNLDKIGFKINIDGKIIEMIQDVDDYNSTILKNDKVNIIEKIIDGKKYIDIEKIENGDDYE
ncbi:MAG: hypothetical protein IJ105_04285 [Bacilli bacterium]|nr:hypothetical protein [Bacilli bacterium]